MTFDLGQLTIAVCTRDRPGTFEGHALPSILTAVEAGCRATVIDQSTDDRTERVVRDVPGLEYLHSAPGLSRARDAALGAATTPFVAFTDDDVSFSPDWPTTVLEAFGDGSDIGAVCGGLADPQGTPLPVAAPGVYRWPLNPFGLGTGGNFALRVDAARRAGGFDPLLGAGARFLAAEDTDILYRVARDGWAVVCVEASEVVHHDAKAATRAVVSQFRYGVGAGAQTAKHAWTGDRAALRVCSELFSRGARRIVRGLRRGDVGAVVRKVAFLAGISVGFVWRSLDRRSAHPSPTPPPAA